MQQSLPRTTRNGILPHMADPAPLDPLAELLSSLDSMLAVTDENVARSRMIRRRIAAIRRRVDAGTPLREIVAAEERPLIVELITDTITALHTVGARLRWAEAAALRAEGMSVTEIATHFGVSRQRVSALLQQRSSSDR